MTKLVGRVHTLLHAAWSLIFPASATLFVIAVATLVIAGPDIEGFKIIVWAMDMLAPANLLLFAVGAQRPTPRG